MPTIKRREFIKTLAAAPLLGVLPGLTACTNEKPLADYYAVPMQGSVRILHTTDIHGQLFPMYFREPNVNLGFGKAYGRLPHLVGARFLQQLQLPANSREAYAYTYLDFEKGAKQYGRMGGFANLKTLINHLRTQAGGKQNTLSLDGGDLWQGSATSLWTRGVDMVEASNLLGIDVMVGHWEFTYTEDEVLSNIALFKGDFIGQNVKVKDESLFADAYPALVEKHAGRGLFDESSGHAFQPYVIKHVNGKRICIIGQAFPRTANANPQEFFPDWSFGLREDEMVELAARIQAEHAPDAMVLLSHNGMDVDLKMAQRVPGLNAVFGGHTHDGIPQPLEVANISGKPCWVTNAGSHGKFVGVMDFDFANGEVQLNYTMLPVFADLIAPDKEVTAYLEQMLGTVYDENIVESRRAEYQFNPARLGKTYQTLLDEKLAIAGDTLYRRGNFMGSWDQLICDALMAEYGSDIALSAGVRWGTTVPKGRWITMGDLMTQVAITYGETYKTTMTGEAILNLLEGIAENLFVKDPYLQSGGDMVRVGGLDYTIAPAADSKRISELRLSRNNTPLLAHKTYTVSGWAAVGAAPEGRLIWDIVREYILQTRGDDHILNLNPLNTPKLLGVKDNPGLADYAGRVA